MQHCSNQSRHIQTVAYLDPTTRSLAMTLFFKGERYIASHMQHPIPARLYLPRRMDASSIPTFWTPWNTLHLHNLAGCALHHFVISLLFAFFNFFLRGCWEVSFIQKLIQSTHWLSKFILQRDQAVADQGEVTADVIRIQFEDIIEAWLVVPACSSPIGDHHPIPVENHKTILGLSENGVLYPTVPLNPLDYHIIYPYKLP